MLKRIAAVVVGAMLAVTQGAASAQVETTPTATKSLTGVIPTPRSFQEAPGRGWKPSGSTRIVVNSASTGQLSNDAQLLSSELAALGASEAGVPVVAGDPARARAGDVVLTLGVVAGAEGEEAYRIETGTHVTITGASAVGVFYGTRTVLQRLSAAGDMPAGVVVDWPDRPQRSLMVDNGRKFFSVRWLEQQIRDLAWFKINTLRLHFSDDQGFRIESRKYPGIVSQPMGNEKAYLTQDEVKSIVALAERYHVAVVPEIDMPGHMEQILKAYPGLKLKDKDGHGSGKVLDISKPEARELATGLIEEFLPLFPGKYWHVGGDEALAVEGGEAKKTPDTSFPQLKRYAESRYGKGAGARDAFTGFLNDLNSMVRAHGRVAKAWHDGLNDGLADNAKVKADRTIEAEYWASWNGEAGPKTFLDRGFALINVNRQYLYWVLEKPKPGRPPIATGDKIYNEWDVTRFSHDQYVRPAPASVRGAQFAIWADQPDFMTETQVADGIRQPVRAFAERIWNHDKLSAAYTDFRTLADKLGRPPGWDRPLPEPSRVTTMPDGGKPSTTTTQMTARPHPSTTTPPPLPTATQPTTVQLAKTGTNTVLPAGIIGLSLLLSGGALLFVRRRLERLSRGGH